MMMVGMMKTVTATVQIQVGLRKEREQEAKSETVWSFQSELQNVTYGSCEYLHVKKYPKSCKSRTVECFTEVNVARLKDLTFCHSGSRLTSKAQPG